MVISCHICCFCRRDALLAQDAEMEMAKRRKVSLATIALALAGQYLSRMHPCCSMQQQYIPSK